MAVLETGRCAILARVASAGQDAALRVADDNLAAAVIVTRGRLAGEEFVAAPAKRLIDIIRY